MGGSLRSNREEEEVLLFDLQTFWTERQSIQTGERRKDVACGGISTCELPFRCLLPISADRSGLAQLTNRFLLYRTIQRSLDCRSRRRRTPYTFW